MAATNLEQDTRLKELDKYAKFFVSKCVSAISAARINDKLASTPCRLPNEKNEWFSLTMLPETAANKQPAASMISFRNVAPSADGSSCCCHCALDVFVETTTGEKMIVETWSLVLERIDAFGYRTAGSAPRQEPFKIYARLGLLLKSVVSTARLLPAQRLARTQSPTSFSLSCRVDSGSGPGPVEHQTLKLRHSIGSVDIEPIGRVSVRVAYCSEAVLTDAAMVSSISSSFNAEQPTPNARKSESYAILSNQGAKSVQRESSVISLASDRAPSRIPVCEVFSPTKFTTSKVTIPRVTIPAFSTIGKPGASLPELNSSFSSSTDSFQASLSVSANENANQTPSYDISLADEILSDFALVQSTSFPFADLEEPLATFVSLLGATEDKVSTKTTLEQRQSFLQCSQHLELSGIMPPPMLPNLDDEAQVSCHLSEMESVQSAFDALVANLCDGSVDNVISSGEGTPRFGRPSFQLGLDN